MGDTLSFKPSKEIVIKHPASYVEQSVLDYRAQVIASGAQDLVQQINEITLKRDLNDWFTYQLVRKAANMIIPKSTSVS